MSSFFLHFFQNFLRRRNVFGIRRRSRVSKLQLLKKKSGKRPGRQPGSPGHGRSQKLAITARSDHRPERCAACGTALSADAAPQAYTAWDEVDIAPAVEDLIGLTFRITRHTLLEVICSCGHVSRAQPWRAPADGQWERVDLGNGVSWVPAWPG
jgi:hypothetical protein